MTLLASLLATPLASPADAAPRIQVSMKTPRLVDVDTARPKGRVTGRDHDGEQEEDAGGARRDPTLRRRQATAPPWGQVGREYASRRPAWGLGYSRTLCVHCRISLLYCARSH